MPVRDDSLAAQYIRAVENPDSVGFIGGKWYAPPTGKGYDPNSRGFDMDVNYNAATKALTEGREGKWLSEEEERQLRLDHMSDNQKTLDKWTPQVLREMPSEEKEAMALGMLYRGDGIKSIIKNPEIRNAYYSGSDEDMQKAVSRYYEKKIPSRAKNHNTFFNSKKKETQTAPKSKFEEYEYKPKFKLYSDGGSLDDDYWSRLPMKEKAEMIRVAIKNGITTMPEIKQAYNEFAKGGRMKNWTMQDEAGYRHWRQNLPKNLRNTNDNDYDMRAAYKAGAQPMWNDEDKSYHLQSRDPETGRIFKAPHHPTYLKALLEDARLGYYPTMDKDGNTYTSTWKANEFAKGGQKDSYIDANDRRHKILLETRDGNLYDSNGNNYTQSYLDESNVPVITGSMPRNTVHINANPIEELKEAGRAYIDGWVNRNMLVPNDYDTRKIGEKLFYGLDPEGYSSPNERVLDALNGHRRPIVGDNLRNPVYAKYLGLDSYTLSNGKHSNVKDNLFVSQFKPQIGSKDVTYFTSPSELQLKGNPLSDENLAMALAAKDHYKKDSFVSPTYDEVMGNFTYSFGQDKKGKYLSYYDKWDLNPFKGSLYDDVDIAEKYGIGHPVELYNRRYYDQSDEDFVKGKYKKYFDDFKEATSYKNISNNQYLNNPFYFESNTGYAYGGNLYGKGGRMNNISQRAMNYLMSKGMSQTGASAIVGTLQAESNLDPTIHAKMKGDSGEGLAQWTGSRKNVFWKTLEAIEPGARKRYGSIDRVPFEKQLDVVLAERPDITNAIHNAKDVGTATDIMLRGYENGGGTYNTMATKAQMDRIYGKWNNGYNNQMKRRLGNASTLLGTKFDPSSYTLSQGFFDGINSQINIPQLEMPSEMTIDPTLRFKAPTLDLTALNTPKQENPIEPVYNPQKERFEGIRNFNTVMGLLGQQSPLAMIGDSNNNNLGLLSYINQIYS